MTYPDLFSIDQGGLEETFKGENLLSDPVVVDQIVRTAVLSALDFWQKQFYGGASAMSGDEAAIESQKIVAPAVTELTGKGLAISTPWTIGCLLGEHEAEKESSAIKSVRREFQIGGGAAEDVIFTMMFKTTSDAMTIARRQALNEVDVEQAKFELETVIERAVCAYLGIRVEA